MDNKETKEYSGEGYEVIGNIKVMRVPQPENSSRSFTLLLDLEDGVASELVKYGSEIFGNLDLLSAGIRGALIEGLARDKGV